ncbi:peptidyl-tRNA hydrolase [Mortierella sp. GBAus27b]|nr:peptidyl-tRNA hydrolase protein 1 [Mortierella sp. GBA43]KAI8351311.1 peptidyl-tRNA hydrolase [Mortierella sp. GBAus27b]
MTSRSLSILVVGLGNHCYPGTRHNAGMMALDSLARRFNAEWVLKPHWQAECATITTEVTLRRRPKPFPSERGPHAAPGAPRPPKPPSEIINLELNMTLLKSRLMMNLSGSSVSRAVRDLKLAVPDVMVVHDDLERDVGKLSFKSYGSPNGHNGIKSCHKYLKTQHYKRLRIGIGRPPFNSRGSDVVADYVLGRFSPSELETLEEIVFPKAGDEIIRMMTDSPDPARRF